MMPDESKKGWRTWRFEQMAVVSNERIDNPAEANVEHYVGLEHLDSDSLAIRRWGSPSDVEATKLRFRTGDIIFGRRRVYQRKLAVAPFEGICSAHAMVLRARPEVALPEFLPFFMQSDLFMERAKQISVGSLSPTINWKTLAKEEFSLPPLEEQRRIAEVLQAVQSARERLLALHETSIRALEALAQYALGEYACTNTIAEVCEVNPESMTRQQLASDEVWDYADLSSVSYPMQIVGLTRVCLRNAPSRAQRIARDGDLLVSTVRPNLKGHMIVGDHCGPIVASTGFAVLRPHNPESAEFLIGLLLSRPFLQHCEGRVTGTAYPAVRPRDVADFPIPDIAQLSEQGLVALVGALVRQVRESLRRYKQFSRETAGVIAGEVLTV